MRAMASGSCMHSTFNMGASLRRMFTSMPSALTHQSMPPTWQQRVLANRFPFVFVTLLVTSSLYGSCICLVSGHMATAPEPYDHGSMPLLNKNETLISAPWSLIKRDTEDSSVLQPGLNHHMKLQELDDKEEPLGGEWKNVTEAQTSLHRTDIAMDELHLQQESIDTENVLSNSLGAKRSASEATLAVFSYTGCPYSEEALREAQLAQDMVQSLGGSVKVVNVAIKQETEHAKILGISTIPCLRLYGNNNLKSATYKTYESTNVSADEIAHWILRSQNRTVQSLSGTQDAFREVHSRGSPVGPVVDVSVHEGSPRAALIVRLSKNIEQLPSRFTLFKIKYVGSSEREEFRVYRKKLPFDVGEEEYLTLEEPQWEPKSMLALMLEAESRKVYYGDKPSGVLLGKRALLSVYVSRFESLQDIALLLMEFHEAYNDRIAFHIARSSLKEAARSQDTFSHSWGGAVLTDQQANASAYRRIAGVVRELSPFSQYSLSMPFNYHSLKLFLEEWSTGNPELHFRSNHLTYTKKESSVLELNHHQFLDVLNRAKRAPFAVLYYEPNCADCQAYLEAWEKVAEVFSTSEALKGQVLFGQIDGLRNDLIDFDMKHKIPSIAVYLKGPQALDKRILYTGPPLVNNLLEFLAMLVSKHEDL